MDALKFESFPFHLQGLCDITLNQKNSEIISGGNDCIIKFFDLKKRINNQSYDIADEIRAIAFSSDKNMLAYSQSSSVYLVKNLSSISESILVTSFISPISKILFYDKLDYLIAISEDDDIHITNISSLSTYKYKTQHEGSVKDFQISPNKGLLVTSGCDGNIIIVDINNIFGYNVLRKIKISAKVSFESEQRLGLSINEENLCAVGGNIVLKWIDLTNTDYKINSESQISHKNDISQVKWLNSKNLITLDISNNIKCWNYQSKTLLYTFEHNETILRLEYDNIVRVLIFIDKAGSLNVSQSLEFKEKSVNSIYDKIPEATNKLLKININKESEMTDLIGQITSEINEQIEKKRVNEDIEMNLNLSDIEDENGEIKPKNEIEQSNVLLM